MNVSTDELRQGMGEKLLRHFMYELTYNTQPDNPFRQIVASNGVIASIVKSYQQLEVTEQEFGKKVLDKG